MIERVRGRLLANRGTRIVVDVAGFGMEIEVTGRVTDRLTHGPIPVATGDEVIILTRLLVRDDDMRLVGFADEDERDAYDHLQMVAGVGPRLALAIVSTVGPAGLAQAVASGELDPVLRTPGVGKKLVQRIALDLKEWGHSHAVFAGSGAVEAAPGGAGFASLAGWAGGEQDEAVAALVGLGFSLQEARMAIGQARREQAPDADTATVVREGLRFLGNGRMEGRMS